MISFKSLDRSSYVFTYCYLRIFCLKREKNLLNRILDKKRAVNIASLFGSDSEV